MQLSVLDHVAHIREQMTQIIIKRVVIAKLTALVNVQVIVVAHVDQQDAEMAQWEVATVVVVPV